MIAVALLVLLAQAAPADEEFLLTNARIYTGTGAVIEKGAIQIRNGRIVTVGEAPETSGYHGGRIISLDGKTVIPGLVLGASALGVVGNANEDGEEIAPDFRVLDSYDRSSVDVSRARQNGITTALIEPGNRGVIGGIGTVVKTSDRGGSPLVFEMALLKAAMGLAPAAGNSAPRGTSASFFTRRPTTRMGVAWEFKKAFADAGRREKSETSTLQKALARRVPLRVSASRVTDLDTAIQLADEFHLTLTFEEAQEAYKRVDVLAGRKIPIFLRPVAPPPSQEPQEYRLDTFTTLARGGVPTALLPATDKPDGLLAAISFAVRHGATPEEALRAVTLTPAELLDVADRVGSLAPKKDADLVVLSGPPHEITTRVEKVMIDGRWILGERAER